MRRALVVALLTAMSVLAPFTTQPARAAMVPLQHAQFQARVIELVNAERQRIGLPPLVANGPLTRAAQAYAGVLADGACFAHNCGSSLVQRIDQAGYVNWTAAGENLALGQATPEDVMAAWMSSAGHRGAILNGTYKEIGVGLTVRPNVQIVWVLDLGASREPVAATPAASCSPRPAFSVRSRVSGPGRLEVTVAAGTTSGAPSNTLRTARFGSMVNGTIELTGYGQVASGTSVGIAPGTREATFVVRRPTRASTMIPLLLTDACGEWQTFVGAGSGIQ